MLYCEVSTTLGQRLANSGWRILQHGTPSHTGPFPRTQVLPSDHQGQDNGVYEVGKSEVESPEELDAAGVVAHALQLGLGIRDLLREGREGLFELGRGVVTGLYR